MPQCNVSDSSPSHTMSSGNTQTERSPLIDNFHGGQPDDSRTDNLKDPLREEAEIRMWGRDEDPQKKSPEDPKSDTSHNPLRKLQPNDDKSKSTGRPRIGRFVLEYEPNVEKKARFKRQWRKVLVVLTVFEALVLLISLMQKTEQLFGWILLAFAFNVAIILGIAIDYCLRPLS
ncbi:hypothetical protein ACOMHN_017378 [Nucella lapillus]